VQEHFGHARHFHIVDLDTDGYAYVETREIEPRCQGGGAGEAPQEQPHDGSRFAPVVELLDDCEAVVTAQIGEGAAAYVLSHGLRIFEGRGFVNDILEEVGPLLTSEEVAS
jgi:predicted Fe-Mo cluster-binding NifX family protein